MNYLFHLLIFFNIYVILALSLNLVVGYCGLLSLAHASFFALGCYVYALVSLLRGWSFPSAAALAMALGALLSLALSLPSWRFRGDFFVMVSLAVQALLFSLFHNWAIAGQDLGSWQNLTNGPLGISGVPKPAILGIKLATVQQVSALASALTLLSALLVWRLTASPWGRLLKAIRDDELASRSLGKRVRLAKTQVFACSCGLAALAGTVYASYLGYVDPSASFLDHSILLLAMVLVGGVGNFRGPFVGALVLLAVPEVLRFADLPGPVAANLRLLAYGLLLVLFMHYRPQGLAGEYRIE